MKVLPLAAICILLMPCASYAQPGKIADTSAGRPVLETPAGNTLYVWDQEKSGTGLSSCDGSCAQLWPPFKADANAKPEGDWTIVKRNDGSAQWAYKGRPLYTWSKDTTPGDTNGNGYDGNSWHLAEP